jgi:hypothetical protein
MYGLLGIHIISITEKVFILIFFPSEMKDYVIKKQQQKHHYN